ncbi:MAG TPA: pyruvate synthase subunit beta [Candidatus Rokubacteria bacterium]|nr:pyruvate synthase subunit beta [Candidatus Rokubacteria bacterium]
MRLTASELGIRPFSNDRYFGGHGACPGCGAVSMLRQVMQTVGPKAYYFILASCAGSYFPGEFTVCDSSIIFTVYAAGFAEAEGMSQALELRGRTDETVVAYSGDGGAFDIGLGGLSGIAERNANVLVIVNDNQGYQNTGGQQSGGTPRGIITKSTQPFHQVPAAARNRKDLLELLAAHRVPYLATASAAFPRDLDAKLRKALTYKGFKLVHVVTACLNWGFESRLAIRVARLAVETGVHPLYEIEGGRRYRLSYEPTFAPLEDFTRLQRRFQGVDLALLKQDIAERWEDLRYKAARAWPASARQSA